jgi:uncharacterized LabA/DUF88 family protein
MREGQAAVARWTDQIDIRAVGHWRVNFKSKSVEEKGLDVALAVDMVNLAEHYDVALVVSGDSDMLPAMQVAKARGIQVGVVEFIAGHPPERSGRGFSSKMRSGADFVHQVYQTELDRQPYVVKR